MARGDCETAFCAAAAADGIELVRAKVPWINQRSHYGLPVEAEVARMTMSTIFSALGGIEAEQATKRLQSLPGDFVHPDSGVFIEVDEHQHFTSYRLSTLDLYPDDVPLGFDLSKYQKRRDPRPPRCRSRRRRRRY